MVLSSKDNCWPSENLILKTGRKHYRTNIAPWHWQLRSLISAEGNGTLYFPTGSENNHITRLATDTCESETIHVLGFPPRCLAAQSGWVCCGGEYGEFAVIKDANQHGGDGNRTRTNVDDALSSNFQSQLRSLESPPGNDTSLSSSFSRDMFNLLEQRLNGPAKSWTSSSHKYGSERVNCITIWEPPGATSLFPARAGHYGMTVAVLSNNDKTVTMVGLQESEFLDEIKLPDCVNRSLISPDGTLLASICDDPFLYLHTRKATNGKIGDAYEWKSLPRVRLESPAKDARDDCRGSFAASFSPSGRYLAVGIQNGTIRVFDTAALQTADTDALVASFTTSRHPEVHGAVRDMAFCPGPYDLLAWTEHRGRIGVADARTNFAQRQTIILDQKGDFEHLSLTDRSTIDPRLLDQRNERSSRAGSTLHLARLLSQANSPQPPHASTNVDVTSRVNRPFSPEETAILDAVSNERRRREARDTRDARDLIAEDLRASTSWRPHVWAERVSLLLGPLSEHSSLYDHIRAAALNQASILDRAQTPPTPGSFLVLACAISREANGGELRREITRESRRVARRSGRRSTVMGDRNEASATVLGRAEAHLRRSGLFDETGAIVRWGIILDRREVPSLQASRSENTQPQNPTPVARHISVNELTRLSQRETLARILDRDRRESHRPAGVQTSSEQERERRAPTPRRRTSIMQAISQETDRMAGVAPPTLNRMQSSGNNEQSNSPPDSPSPLVADSGVPQPFIPGRLTSGWADLEALYNITGNDETTGLESIRVPPSRTRRAIPVINDGWNDELTGFGTRRSYPNPRLSSRDHTQNPDDTAGLTWSEDGQTLWVGAEDGVYEFKVIGGGVVGLAVSQRLAAAHPESTTLLLERHGHVGTETSSRNSEVIHAGLYYGATSLKTRLCVRGKEQLYAFCEQHAVPHRRTGKWIVAQTDDERDALERLHVFARDEIGVPTRWIDEEERRREDPEVTGRTGILESPTSGIVDSHSLMLALHGLFEEQGGVTALNSNVTAIEPLSGSGGKPGSGGWRITVRDSDTGEESSIETETLVNCAGLGAAEVHNMIAPPEQHTRLYYAKGNYFSYAASHPRVKRLVYPMTMPGAGGLGTHLTLDMAGRVRFGPDVEWVEDPTDLQVSAARLAPAVEAIHRYLPNVDVSALAADYAGIRPKLGKAGAVGQGKGFYDFHIKKEDGFEGWVNLLAIESPGLTSSLAIGDLVEQLMYGSTTPES